MLKVIELVAFPHGGLPLAVKVRVTLPAVISAALAVYTGCNKFGSLKYPVPEVLHNKEI
jgi:hypothetical protein